MRKIRVRLGAVLGSLIMIGSILVGQPAAAAETIEVAGVEVKDGVGSLLVAGTNTTFMPRAFNSVAVLYPKEYESTTNTYVDCSRLGDGDKQTLRNARTDLQQNFAARAATMREKWYVNAIRFQVSQGGLREDALTGNTGYTAAVRDMINKARNAGLIVVVSMQTQSYGCTKGAPALPDQHTLIAWRQLTGALSGDKGIIVEVFNEPHTKGACTQDGDVNWPRWKYGCDGAETGTEGMLWLGKQLRGLVSGNVLLFDGDNKAGKFNGFTPPNDMPNNSAYAIHPYYFNDDQDAWTTRFGHLQAAGYALVATEWNAVGEDLTLVPTLIRNYLPDRKIGLFLHSWDAPVKVVVPPSYDPKPNTGAATAQQEFAEQYGAGAP